MYEQHLKSKKHLRKKLRKETASVWRCEACEITMPNDDEWVRMFKKLTALLYM